METVLPTLEERIEQLWRSLISDIDCWSIINEYNEILQEKLELWMIVPTDKEGNILEEPVFYGEGDEQYFEARRDEFDKAKQRCLFDVKHYESFSNNLYRLIFSCGTMKTFEVGNDNMKEFTYAPLTEAGVEYFNLNK